MSIIDRLSCRQERRDEIPNQELARKLVGAYDTAGIEEIVKNLSNKDRKIQSDCIKVLYEAGYLKPELIGEHVTEFLKLLKSRNNRMVWGAMMALSTIGDIKGKEIFTRIEDIYGAMEKGTVITVDHGVKVLAKLCAQDESYEIKIFPYLINHLKTCRPKEVPQHAESILIAVNHKNKKEYLGVLKEREDYMTASQCNRIKRIYKTLDEV